MLYRLPAGTEIKPVGPLSALLIYWETIRGRHLLPKRSDFDPIAVAPLLSRVFLAEWQSPSQRLRFRLVGTALVSAAGADHTGRWLDEIVQDQDPLIDMCRRCVDEARPLAHIAYREQARIGSEFLPHPGDSATLSDALAKERSADRHNRKEWPFTRILLPLDRSDGAGGMILGLEDHDPPLDLIVRSSA